MKNTPKGTSTIFHVQLEKLRVDTEVRTSSWEGVIMN